MQSNRMPLWQQIEVARWLTKFPALTVMVFLRRDIGYRLLNPLHLFWMCGALCFIAVLFDESYPRANLLHLFVFAVLSFLLGIAQRSQRWTEHKRGKLQHSYYIGTSPFDLFPFPKFLKRRRRLARFADPAACWLIGFYFLPVSRPLSLWVIFAGMCLRVFEDTVHRKELNQSMNVLDGLVESEVHTNDVETFERPPETPPKQIHQTTQGVPTGIGADIAKQIKRRRR